MPKEGEKPKIGVRRNSQNARILRVLSDGKWHTSANVQRKSGASRLNSRLAQLRDRGYEIETDQVEGKVGRLGHRYRLLNPPTSSDLAKIIDPLPTGPRDEVPRNKTHRYRIYRMVFEELELLATATTPADIGEAIVELGREGAFAQSCMGLLDTHATESHKGEWIVNPFDSAPL